MIFVHSDEQVDGTEIAVSPDWVEPADAVGTVLLDDLAMPTDVLVRGLAKESTPPMWFTEVRESTGRPPAVSLLAFTGAGVRAGRILDSTAVADVGVVSANQLAAIRWYPATGEIDQIYVAPEARRRGIATVLVHATAMIAVSRGWKRLWSDGQRTVLGEELRNSRDWRDRAAELTHIAPPMTPGEAAIATPTGDASTPLSR
jgi:GNAT superfamily N-acetyltransferase